MTEQAPKDQSFDSGEQTGRAPSGRGTTGETPPLKADVGKRAVAFLIDAAIASLSFWVLALLPGVGWFVGGLVAAAYMLLRDGLNLDSAQGRSVGKKLMNLQVVHGAASVVDFSTSARRNWTVALSEVSTLLLMVPSPLNILLAILLGIVGFVALAFEVFLVVTSVDGRRWGDRLAGTKVAETIVKP